ncbi:MAG TPA: TadE/TadG family type IV pilus assembly protein [Xanthobacteraceae bacterium]|nr:TadE/TadG family type IV pilus assembly protein [Xanthobacteraceae bacterium]
MTRLRREGLLTALRRLMRERHGVSAVEFALILPIMITLFIGGSEITQGITIKRKVTIATRTIADLVSQDVSVTDADLTAVFAATTTVLAPYPPGTLKMVISSVYIDANNNASVVWSAGHNGATARTAGSSVTLPNGLNAFPKTSLLWAEAEYTYTPTIGYVLSGAIDLKDKLYLRPRLTNCIERVTGGQTIDCPA